MNSTISKNEGAAQQPHYNLMDMSHNRFDVTRDTTNHESLRPMQIACPDAKSPGSASFYLVAYGLHTLPDDVGERRLFVGPYGEH